MKGLLTALFATLLLAPASAKAQSCEDATLDGDAFFLESPPHRVLVVPDPAPLRVNQSFTLLLTVCEGPGDINRVDAGMPMHGHGMNYRPTMTRLDDNRVRVEGMLFHMPGSWEITTEIRDGDTATVLSKELSITR